MIFRDSVGPDDASAGPEAGGHGGPRPLRSLRTLKTVDWHRLDAALAGSWSYFGTPAPGRKSVFLDPGTDFRLTGLARGMGAPDAVVAADVALLRLWSTVRPRRAEGESLWQMPLELLLWH